METAGAEREDLFEGFSIWEEEEYRRLQGTFPVISLSFAGVKEAFVHGYWKELAELMRSLFNAAFKTNPFLDRAIMTGITRVSRESIFSDLNNLQVVTTTSNMYADRPEGDECFYESGGAGDIQFF